MGTNAVRSIPFRQAGFAPVEAAELVVECCKRREYALPVLDEDE